MKSKNIINTINHMTREGDSRIMDKYIVDFYEKEDGEAPAGDFIRSLDAKMKAKIFRIVDMLEENAEDTAERD